MKTFRCLVLLLCVLCCSQVRTQARDTDEALLVSQVEWSQNPSAILVTLREGGLTVIDPATHLIIMDVPGELTGPIEDAALQPNGSQIATVDRFTGLNIWDMHTGSLVYFDRDLIVAWRVAWSPNGQYLLVSSIDEMVMRDARGNPLFSLPGAPEDVPHVEFSPNEQYLALGFTYRLEIYDLTQRQSLISNIIPGFRHSIQWSTSGSIILAAITDATREGNFYRVVTFDPFTGERLHTYSGFPNELTSARWSPDETQILATSVDGTAYLVDGESGSITPIFTTTVPLLSADWSPYGGQVAIGAPADSEAMPAIDGDDTNPADLPLQIVVPDPSLERLRSIAALCDAPLPLPNAAQADQLREFVAQVEALPVGSIPPACAADLIAVARAIPQEQ